MPAPKLPSESEKALFRYREAVAVLSGTILPPWRLKPLKPEDAAGLSKVRASLPFSTVGFAPSDIVLLANQYFEGFGVKEDKEIALALWKEAADVGDVDAMFAYAAAICTGIGNLQPNPVEAARLFEEILKQRGELGHKWAEFNLARMLAVGEGVRKDERRALHLFHAAGEKGIVQAFAAAASMLASGRGAPRNDTHAAKLFQLGADEKDPLCMVSLADFYQTGRGGLQKDLKEAFKLTIEAAGMGYVYAIHNAGMMYLNGTGCEKNLQMAQHYFRQASLLGFAPSQVNLAELTTNTEPSK